MRVTMDPALATGIGGNRMFVLNSTKPIQRQLGGDCVLRFNAIGSVNKTSVENSVSIGADVGTSGIKLVAAGREGIVSKTTVSYPTVDIDGLQQRVDAGLVWNALCSGIKDVLKEGGIAPSRVLGLNLSVMHHTSGFMDSSMKPVSPFPLWCTTLPTDIIARISKDPGVDFFRMNTLSNITPGFSLAHLLWLQEQGETGEKFGHLSSFLKFMLTGDFHVDAHNAAGMMMLDMAGMDWSQAVLDRFGIDKGILPQITDPMDVVSWLNESGAQAAGLEYGTPFVEGMGDQGHSAIGAGVFKPGTISMVEGTSGVIGGISRSFPADPMARLQSMPFLGGMYQAFACLISYCSTMDHWMNELGYGRNFETMEKEVSAVNAGKQGVFYEPSRAGRRTPDWDATARDQWVHKGSFDSLPRAVKMRAVLEGLSSAMFECEQIVEDVLKIHPDKIVSVGGGSLSPVWNQMKADLFGREIRTLETGPYSGALAAALVAGSSIGMWPTLETAVGEMISNRSGRSFVPNSEETGKAQELYAAWRQNFRG